MYKFRSLLALLQSSYLIEIKVNLVKWSVNSSCTGTLVQELNILAPFVYSEEGKLYLDNFPCLLLCISKQKARELNRLSRNLTSVKILTDLHWYLKIMEMNILKYKCELCYHTNSMSRSSLK